MGKMVRLVFDEGKMDITLYSNKMDEYLKHDSVKFQLVRKLIAKSR